jgi:hypothetical protein
MEVFLIVLATLATVAGTLYYFNVYRKRPPSKWTHTGIARPPFTDEAVQIILKHTPGLPNGYIEWIEGPWMEDLGAGGGTIKVAGILVGTKPVRIKLMYADPVENSALTHEMGHAWSDLTGQGFGEPNTDPKFNEWITKINAEIKASRLQSY